MHRCIELAKLGAGYVAPNPMVGAVLVHEDRIIGEGYHQQYGQAHAEVNCINSVKVEDKHLISSSTLYVSLEPCAHYGKTPPCSALIIEHKIPVVVIGCRDPFKEVDGKGIEQLRHNNITVHLHVLEDACKQLNKRFFTFHQQQRPYIILKWAQTADGKMAADNDERLLISNEYTHRIVHQWRSEEAGILVGTETALKDNPSLTNRLWSGQHPKRMVIDRKLRLPQHLNLFNNEVPTIVFNEVKDAVEGNTMYYPLQPKDNAVQQIAKACYQLHIQSIIVEGGAALLQSFIDQGLWDEARVITNTTLSVNGGLAAPLLTGTLVNESRYFNDIIQYYTP